MQVCKFVSMQVCTFSLNLLQTIRNYLFETCNIILASNNLLLAKKLFPFAPVVRLVIFVFSKKEDFWKENPLFCRNPLPQFLVWLQSITTLRCHYKIIQNEGLFYPSLRHEFVTYSSRREGPIGCCDFITFHLSFLGQGGRGQLEKCSMSLILPIFYGGDPFNTTRQKIWSIYMVIFYHSNSC